MKALLHRHPEAAEEDISFLTSTLKIPSTWIHHAKAAQLASAGDIFGQYHALLRANLYDTAHRILLVHLVPEAIIRGDLVLLRRLCETLEDKGVTNWEYGAKVRSSLRISDLQLMDDSSYSNMLPCNRTRLACSALSLELGATPIPPRLRSSSVSLKLYHVCFSCSPPSLPIRTTFSKLRVSVACCPHCRTLLGS